MKTSKRGNEDADTHEIGGSQTSFRYRPQNTGWAPSVSYAEAVHSARTRGSDHAFGYEFSPAVRAVEGLTEVLSRGQVGHLGNVTSGTSDETHLLHNPSLDWNRHMDKANIPESLRQAYGADIVAGTIHRLRAKEHHLDKYDLGPLGQEQFNNTFNI